MRIASDKPRSPNHSRSRTGLGQWSGDRVGQWIWHAKQPVSGENPLQRFGKTYDVTSGKRMLLDEFHCEIGLALLVGG